MLSHFCLLHLRHAYELELIIGFRVTGLVLKVTLDYVNILLASRLSHGHCSILARKLSLQVLGYFCVYSCWFGTPHVRIVGSFAVSHRHKFSADQSSGQN